MPIAEKPDYRTAASMLAWTPLLAGALSCYGPVAFNYGFALYFLDYRHGFVKRGLVGEMFAGFSFMLRGELLGIEYGFLAVAFALTYLVFRRLLFGDLAERRLAAVLLSGPALLPHLGFLFAQPDVTLYLLVLGCFAVFVRTPPRVAAPVSCVLCCVGLLGHEAFCLMFYPLIVAILLHLCCRGRLSWAAGVAHLLVVFAVFCAVVHWGGLKISPDAMLREAQSRTNVGVQRQVFDVMASSFGEQRALVRRMYTPGVLRILEVTLALSAPYFLLLARLLFRSMVKAACGVVQQLLTGILFISPLLLCALGHDTTRWIGAMCLDATLFVLFLFLTDAPEGPVRTYLCGWASGATVLPWMAYLIAMGPYGATGLRSAELLVGSWFGP